MLPRQASGTRIRHQIADYRDLEQIPGWGTEFDKSYTMMWLANSVLGALSQTSTAEFSTSGVWVR